MTSHHLKRPIAIFPMMTIFWSWFVTSIRQAATLLCWKIVQILRCSLEKTCFCGYTLRQVLKCSGFFQFEIKRNNISYFTSDFTKLRKAMIIQIKSAKNAVQMKDSKRSAQNPNLTKYGAVSGLFKLTSVSAHQAPKCQSASLPFQHLGPQNNCACRSVAAFDAMSCKSFPSRSLLRLVYTRNKSDAKEIEPWFVWRWN